jgi:glycerol-3-phosphate acyltransferase PlsY
MYNVIAIAAGYLLGSIPFALLITRIFGVTDIRRLGSGNIGATNAWRAAGPAAGVLVAVFDIGKGSLAVFLASQMPKTGLGFEYLRLLTGFAAVMGHIFPVYLGFKGGKGVNTALGVMLMLLPVEVLLACLVFVITVYVGRYISLGSILAAFAFALVILIEWSLKLTDIDTIYVPASVLLFLAILVTHRSNIKRLLEGRERRFGFTSKVSKEVNENV